MIWQEYSQILTQKNLQSKFKRNDAKMSAFYDQKHFNSFDGTLVACVASNYSIIYKHVAT